jgi:hypothetical protein
VLTTANASVIHKEDLCPSSGDINNDDDDDGYKVPLFRIYRLCVIVGVDIFLDVSITVKRIFP